MHSIRCPEQGHGFHIHADAPRPHSRGLASASANDPAPRHSPPRAQGCRGIADVLARISDAIRATGARLYLEVVSTTPRDCLRSAEIGRELSVDRLAAELKSMRSSKFFQAARPRTSVQPADISQTRRHSVGGGSSNAAPSPPKDAPVSICWHRATGAIHSILSWPRAAGSARMADRGRLSQHGRANPGAQERRCRCLHVVRAVFDGSFSPTRARPCRNSRMSFRRAPISPE